MSRELQDILDVGEIDDFLMDSNYTPDSNYKVATKKYVDDADALKVNLTNSNQAYDTATGTTVLDATNRVLDCTSGTFTVTLPTAVGIQSKEYIVKNSGSGVITLDGDGSETIDGETDQTLNPGDSLTVLSTNTGWIII